MSSYISTFTKLRSQSFNNANFLSCFLLTMSPICDYKPTTCTDRVPLSRRHSAPDSHVTDLDRSVLSQLSSQLTVAAEPLLDCLMKNGGFPKVRTRTAIHSDVGIFK